MNKDKNGSKNLEQNGVGVPDQKMILYNINVILYFLSDSHKTMYDSKFQKINNKIGLASDEISKMRINKMFDFDRRSILLDM